MRIHRAHARRRAGFTLIELSISLALLGIIVGLGALVGGAGRSAFVQTSTTSQVEARVKQALDRIAVEVEMASAGSLDPQLTGLVTDTNTLSMQQVVGIQAGAAVLGDPLTVRFEPDPADPVDGVDNDGDGVIDEGRVVLVRDDGGPNELSTTICKDVRRFLEGEQLGGGDDNGNGLTDESGFLITRDGDLLTIQLTVEEARSSGETTVRTSSTSVLIRN